MTYFYPKTMGVYTDRGKKYIFEAPPKGLTNPSALCYNLN